MADEKCCKNCKYFHAQEKYWHDHYLIPEYHFCEYLSRYTEKEVAPDDCCENYQSIKSGSTMYRVK